jgi:hypothetical protein
MPRAVQPVPSSSGQIVKAKAMKHIERLQQIATVRSGQMNSEANFNEKLTHVANVFNKNTLQCVFRLLSPDVVRATTLDELADFISENQLDAINDDGWHNNPEMRWINSLPQSTVGVRVM